MQRCLVILNRPEQAVVLLSLAASLIKQVGGDRIDVLAAREPPEEGLGPMGLTEESIFVMRQDQRDWADSLHATFHQWLEKEYGSPADRLSAVEVNWLDPEIAVERIISGYGKDAGLILLSFPDRQDSEQKQRALRAAIFETNRPVLLVPPFWDRPCGHTVLMAWRESPCCRKAFTASRVLLGQAEAVTVLSSEGETMPADLLPGIPYGSAYLPHRQGPDAIGQELLEIAHHEKADLLVMGGYQHGKLYNRIMGSVTDYILQHPAVPVLLHH
ncbi:universal stress protein [Acetobacter orleanensis]|uniref:Universal stress protein UspA n=1 Tax=Acetobacter orleanensis TaxID=104099 RepID=A0A4Y3TLG9_9PROT|nr:universal stress protein [Acetobacter orleanensis]KXV65210.1 universal stress protein UspA [Acetobacter orleanensis]PCD79646.1 universal stress protein [Acetobacter orleanensis]GAN68747.1 universal stress protein UspA [Acetobacter orleanensis JCM 7639]GBR28018.1 universal stress protein UspA [Acetobacter orleanensis NRIC 0473]GEB82279.1 universal stress protein UspA [Acetobacter orleanensis]